MFRDEFWFETVKNLRCLDDTTQVFTTMEEMKEAQKNTKSKLLFLDGGTGAIPSLSAYGVPFGSALITTRKVRRGPSGGFPMRNVFPLNIAHDAVGGVRVRVTDHTATI